MLLKKRNVFYILNCLFDFYSGITGAIFVLFLYSYKLNEIEVNFIVGLPLLIAFIMEIPTGVFSDYIGYRKSILLSGLLLIFANILFLVGNNIYWFIWAQMFVGISTTFITGTLDAWIMSSVDESKENNIFIKKNKYSSIIILLTGFASGLLANKAIKLVFILALISSIIFELIALKYINVPTKNIVKNRSMYEHFNEMKNIFTSSIGYCMDNRSLLKILLYYCLFTFCTGVIFVYWSPIMYNFNNMNYFLIGLSWTLMRIFMLLGNIVVDMIKSINYIKLMSITIVCGLIIIMMTYATHFYLFFILLMIFEFLLGIIYPMRETLLNKNIQSFNRATLLSFNSMLVCIFNYSSIMLMGIFSKYYSIYTSWTISGILMIVMAVIFIKFRVGSNTQ